MVRATLLLLGLVGCADPSPAAVDAARDGSTPIDAHVALDAAIDGSGEEDAAGAIDAGEGDAGPFDEGTAYADPEALGDVAGALVEVSGIVASRTQPGIFWVHNDSGGGNRLYAIDATAATVATITLTGAGVEDWEDIAIGPAPGGAGDVIYVANVGDNAARTSDGASGRSGIELYRIAEPDASAGDAAIAPERTELRYPSRPYDCEAVFVDQPTGDVWLVTKEASPAEVFVARAPLAPGAPITLEHAGTIVLAMATAADASRDGSRFVVRGYGEIRVYERPAGGAPIDALGGSFLPAPSASAAEAVCFEPDGWGLYTIAEGAGATLFHIGWE